MKTIKQIAESLNVSKVTIYKAIKSDEMKDYVTKSDNTTFISIDGEQLLINMFKDNSKVGSKPSKLNEEKSAVNNDEILFLREQVKQLTEQLDKEREHSREEREYSREQLIKSNDKIASLADDNASLARELIKLNENSQVLLREQNLKLLSEPAPEKISLWKKIFKKKSSQ